jgi:hypothetical protein
MKREDQAFTLLPPGPFPRPVASLASLAGRTPEVSAGAGVDPAKSSDAGGGPANSPGIRRRPAPGSRRLPATAVERLGRRLLGWHRHPAGVAQPVTSPGASRGAGGFSRPAASKRRRPPAEPPPRRPNAARRGGRRPNGFQVLELIKVASAIGLVTALALPPAVRGLAHLRLRWAAEQVVNVLRGARRLAAQRGVGVAIRFGTGAGGELTYALYADGTGNGVRERDVETGEDPEIAAPRPLPLVGRGVRLGFPPGKRVRDPAWPGRYLSPAERPIEFAGSALASFDPLGGGATPGVLFLTDGEGLARVRVEAGTGASSILIYDLRSEKWH